MRSIGGWRAAGLAVCGVVSTGAGLLLVFTLVTPQAIAGLGTAELVGLLALLAMPALGAWAYGRHAAEWVREENARAMAAAPKLVGGAKVATARGAGVGAELRRAA